MKILVTGGAGFLGSHLSRRLADEGHAVTVLRRPSKKPDALAGSSVRQELGDVMDAAAVERAVAGQEIVVHAAAGRLPGPDGEAVYAPNVVGTRNVAAACLKHGVRRMVHVSSVAAIGVPDDRRPADERFAFNLDDSKLYYHLSKHRAEGVVNEAVARGLDAVVVNPATIWGPFGAAHRGGDVLRHMRHQRWMQMSPGGVCIVHVGDVVGGIVGAMLKGESGERYILGGENLPYRAWLDKITAAIGARPRVVPVPALATDALAALLKPLTSVHTRFYGLYLRSFLASRSAFYDSTKASRALGYRARPFDDILDEAARMVIGA